MKLIATASRRFRLDLPIANFHGRKLKQPKSIVIPTNIYYKPIYEAVLTIGIPEIVSTDFEEEFMRRIGIYLEAIDLSAPTLDEAKPAYDRFIPLPRTYPQDPDRIKNIIQNVRVLSKSHEKR